MKILLPKDNLSFEIKNAAGHMILGELRAVQHYYRVNSPDKYTRDNYCCGFISGCYISDMMTPEIYGKLMNICTEIMLTKGELDLDACIREADNDAD